MDSSEIDSNTLAIAARMHVALRRKTGRVTDTEWMASNADYAREVLRVARAADDGELDAIAARLEAAVFRNGGAAASRRAQDMAGTPTQGRYVGSLR
ncbi:hypothetical protein [Derxia gummosa]|uniref:Uncharacterized protein n=1 Tax=Derxia gummosa DSM 723 TaxID=1121388 RepID=A0A8B6X1P7_9BURK|nr:hypothetical protein [Derxia gummosa]